MISPSPSAPHRNASSVAKLRETAVAMQMALHVYSPPRRADLRRTRSTTMPANGEEMP